MLSIGNEVKKDQNEQKRNKELGQLSSTEQKPFLFSSSSYTAFYQSCEMKIRLLYFDSNYIYFLYRVLLLLSPINPFHPAKLNAIPEYLSIAKKEYERLNSALNKPQNSSTLREIDQTLEKTLSETHSYRCQLWKILSWFLHIDQTSGLKDIPRSSALLGMLLCIKPLLFDIDDEMDRIIQFTNFYGDPQKHIRAKFELNLKTIPEFIQKKVEGLLAPHELKRWLLSQFLFNHLGAQYKTVASAQRKILLFQNWLKKLVPQSQALLASSEQKNLSYTLKAKKILFDEKYAYYEMFFKHLSFDVVEAFIAQNLFAWDLKSDKPLSVSRLLDQLGEQVQTLKGEIRSWEKKLKIYSWANDFISALIRLWTQGYYYQLSEKYFEWLEERSTQNPARWMRLLGMDTRLEPNFLSFFITLGSGLLVKEESIISDWIGLGVKTYYGISPGAVLCLFSKANQWVFHAVEARNWDEEKCLSITSALQWPMGLTLAIAPSAWIFGMSAEVFGAIAAGYTMATLLKDLSGYLIDKIYLYHTGSKADALPPVSWQLGVKFPIQFFSYLVGSVYLGPKVYGSIRSALTIPESEQLISNSELCKKYASHCKKEALRMFELKEEKPFSVIHSMWRESMKKYHPDKNPVPEAELKAVRLNNAHDRLRELSV